DGGLYAVVGYVAWHEVARRVGRVRLPPRRRAAYRVALAPTAAGAACWWAGRTASPWCDPDSLLQPHAAWHLLGASALACWAVAALDPAAQARSENPMSARRMVTSTASEVRWASGGGLSVRISWKWGLGRKGVALARAADSASLA